MSIGFILSILLIALQVCTVFPQEDPDVYRSFSDIITSKGYPCEQYSVPTNDGWRLGTFRIPYGKAGNTGRRQPVLLFHGLLDSAFTWIINFPDQSLAYMLADQGYDVWMGNARGNRYSLSNVNYPPSSNSFWNFTFDEFAEHDLPTTIKFVLNATGFEQLYYIGHSQGTAQMFAALSDDTSRTLTPLIKFFIGLGPVTAPVHQTNVFISILVDMLSNLQGLFKLLGVQQFLPPFTGVLGEVVNLFCFEDPKPCEAVIELICGRHQGAFNDTRMDVVVAHEPGGTSVKNMIHWGQMIKEGLFQKYDYGTEGNMNVYQQPTPPLYNLKNIDPKLPIALFYGDQDDLATPVDVLSLVSNLPAPPVFIKEIPSYAHLDFCWATDANVQVYNDIIELMKKY